MIAKFLNFISNISSTIGSMVVRNRQKICASTPARQDLDQSCM